MRARGPSIAPPRRFVIAAVAVHLLAACPGGGAARPGGPGPTSTGAVGADAGGAVGGEGDQGPAEAVTSNRAGAPLAAPAPPPPPPPVSPAECGQLVDRLLAIGLAEQRARDPRAPQATAEQQAAIRASLLEQAGVVCASMPRARWQCAVAAADRAAMDACAGPE